jgi:vitamin B12 transporter
MCLVGKVIILFFYFILVSSSVFSKEIPIIVISAGKSPQSKSTVGSDVAIINETTISNSGESFVGDLLSENLMGMNYFQSGGYGTTSGIQLRGQPKRYSTVYINGIKLSDPSTPSNDYYFGNIMNGSLESIEVLKGSQSTLYGSGAIAGTINLFTKKGREGHHQDITVTEGSFGSRNINFSADGKTNKFDYFLGATNFSSDGISARSDDDENDRYRNDNFEANLGYQINDILRAESYMNYVDSFLEYDSVAPRTYSGAIITDDNSSDDQQTIFSSRFIIDNGNLKNTISYNKTYFLRETVTAYLSESPTKKMYEGQRDAINLVGQYNFNLDTKIVYGLESEKDAAEIPSNYKNTRTYHADKYYAADEEINSQYLDLQFRPLEKIYSTIGFRRDHHSIAGEHYTGRATVNIKANNNTTIRSSFGTGLRMPSLNEYYFGATVADRSTLVPEESTSFDFGLDQKITENFEVSTTLFIIDYKNYIGGWKSNVDQGLQYTLMNTDARNTSFGYETLVSLRPVRDLDVNLGYTLTKSYDGSTCSNLGDTTCNEPINVRIPIHSFSSSLVKKFDKNFTASAQYKYIGERRDYGGSDNNFKSVMLHEYSLINLSTDYKVNDYKINLTIKNLFDTNYTEAWGYNTPGRNLNFKFGKQF